MSSSVSAIKIAEEVAGSIASDKGSVEYTTVLNAARNAGDGVRIRMSKTPLAAGALEVHARVSAQLRVCFEQSSSVARMLRRVRGRGMAGATCALALTPPPPPSN